VTDLVSAAGGGEAYGNAQVFEDGSKAVMTKLIEDLPKWLAVLPEAVMRSRR
jgi:hypothetical protein